MSWGRKEIDMESGTKDNATDLRNLSNDELSHQLVESLRNTVALARLRLSVGDSSGTRQKNQP